MEQERNYSRNMDQKQTDVLILNHVGMHFFCILRKSLPASGLNPAAGFL